jgi:hypothetical protein
MGISTSRVVWSLVDTVKVRLRLRWRGKWRWAGVGIVVPSAAISSSPFRNVIDHDKLSTSSR